jgi:hypothetical protein
MQRTTSTYIGHRSGVEWRCYRLPSDTDETFAARVEQMREAFEKTPLCCGDCAHLGSDDWCHAGPSRVRGKRFPVSRAGYGRDGGACHSFVAPVVDALELLRSDFDARRAAQ